VPSVGVEPTLGVFRAGYYFLYPVGHFGFVAVIFFVSLPLAQAIVVFQLLAISHRLTRLPARQVSRIEQKPTQHSTSCYSRTRTTNN
jgi:hypothetical protein